MKEILTDAKPNTRLQMKVYHHGERKGENASWRMLRLIWDCQLSHKNLGKATQSTDTLGPGESQCHKYLWKEGRHKTSCTCCPSGCLYDQTYQLH